MTANRLKELKTELKKTKTLKDKKIWSIFYKERNKFVYITNKQLKDLLDIDRVKITGKYMEIEIEAIKRKVWVDCVVKLSAVEEQAFKEQQKPKDYLEDNEQDEEGVI